MSKDEKDWDAVDLSTLLLIQWQDGKPIQLLPRKESAALLEAIRIERIIHDGDSYLVPIAAIQSAGLKLAAWEQVGTRMGDAISIPEETGLEVIKILEAQSGKKWVEKVTKSAEQGSERKL